MSGLLRRKCLLKDDYGCESGRAKIRPLPPRRDDNGNDAASPSHRLRPAPAAAYSRRSP
ncbi:hypothetical protein [Azotobacter chroococcum]|uniref:Uncharacterized protein n=1 Tax=Azotobacter chroococcum TaxID=353 RepID=A0AAP9YHD3_9GAMM|nr:hypothetical protein [Azotobacter chroococcum]QQE90217.1 hypothetical protein GKQ51_07940 [Azotobacter chroococcum]